MKEPKIKGLQPKKDAGYLYFLLGRLLRMARLTNSPTLKTELLTLEREIEVTLKELKVLVF